jgi:FeS assembly SUF system protein
MTMFDKKELKDQIIEAVKKVYDPEIPVDIYELGLIYDIIIDNDANVEVRMTLTSPNCPSAAEIPSAVRVSVSKVQEVNEVEVEVVFDPPWGPEKMSEDAKLVLGMA